MAAHFSAVRFSFFYFCEAQNWRIVIVRTLEIRKFTLWCDDLYSLIELFSLFAKDHDELDFPNGCSPEICFQFHKS